MVKKNFLILIITVSILALKHTPVSAQESCEQIWNTEITSINPNLINFADYADQDKIPLTVIVANTTDSLPSGTYYVSIHPGGQTSQRIPQISTTGTSFNLEIEKRTDWENGKILYLQLWNSNWSSLCRFDRTITITPYKKDNCQIYWSQSGQSDPHITYNNPSCVHTTAPIHINVTNAVSYNNTYTGTGTVRFNDTNYKVSIVNGTATTTANPQKPKKDTIIVYPQGRVVKLCESPSINVKVTCSPEEMSATLPGTGPAEVFDLCKPIPDPIAQAKCKSCLGTNPNDPDSRPRGVWTAVGCIRVDSKEFIEDILLLATGIGGGIALLLMIFGAFRVSTSAGDPKAAQSGREIISGAVAGLLIIIFSVVILNLIGVELLKIPGL